MEDSTAAHPVTRKKRWWWPILKLTLFAVMMYFIGQRAVALWQSNPAIALHIDVRWLIPAAVLYLVGWLPSVWFWRTLMRRLNQHPTGYETARAYYVGHLGKYVPGKALVLLIRGGFLKEAGVNPILGALTAVYETLVTMAAGAAIAVALAPAVIPDGLWERLPAALRYFHQQPLLLAAIVVVATIASTPFSAWLFTRIGRRALPPTAADTVPATGITAGTVMQGVFITSLVWVFHAFSLGCTLQAVSDTSLSLAQFPIWLASVALSTFSGFVILIAPGGLGVREWVLIETLKDQPDIGYEKALVVAGLLRLVWFAAEVVIAGLLYFIKPRPRGKVA